MKSIIFTILILVIACSSDPKNERLTGDLYFGLFRIGSYYNLPDSMISRFEAFIDTINYETADKEQKKFINQFKRLKEEGLLHHPFVQIKDGRDSVLILYLEKNDYDQIKMYKRKQLQSERKLIRIEADVKKIDGGLFYCSNLLKVEKISGDTWIKSNKWKVEDYN
jgi:hypothetical protein